MLYPLERFPELEELREDLLPGSCQPTQDGGNDEHIHALRLYTGIPLFTLINQDRMEKVGLPSNTSVMTWPKLLKLAQKFSAENQDPAIYTSAMNIPNSYQGVKPFVELMGQDLFNQTKSPVTPQGLCSIFSSESAFEALENLRSLLDADKVLYSMGHPRFALGDVGIQPFGTCWDMSLIQTLNPSLRYFASPIPTSRHHRKYCSFSSGFYVGIFHNSITSDLQLHAAWEWLQFLFHKRSQYLLSQEFKFPSRHGADSYLQQQAPMLNTMANNMLKNSIPQPDFPGIRQAYSTIGRELAAFMLKKNSPEICLRNIREKLLMQFN
jgi:ABC-type glycerol-3-phosphate transport system substrate-binding protein